MKYIKSVRLTDEQVTELTEMGFILDMDSKGHHNKLALYSVWVKEN